MAFDEARLEPILDDGVCQEHRAHSPHPRSVDVHHIWPRSWGGPDAPQNRVVVCPTGHRNIHRLLIEYVHHGGTPPWKIRRRFSTRERALAKQGWEAAHAAGGGESR